MTRQPGPLTAFRVIEVNAAAAALSTRFATAMAGKIAADLGAVVVRVEPPDGDPLRRHPPFLRHGTAQEQSALFHFLTLSKRSVVIDRSSASGQAVLADLATNSDALLTDDPALIPAASRVGVLVQPCAAAGGPVEEIEILATSGLLDIIGDPAREPLKLGGHQCAYTAGLAAFTGLIAALAAGARETVDVSVLDVAYWTNWKTFADRLTTGRTPTRLGAMTEWQVAACRDGHVAIVYLDNDWPALCRMIGAPEWNVPAYATRQGRATLAPEILARLRTWLAPRSRAEVKAAALAGGLPIAPVLQLGELAADPQYVAQEFMAAVAHPSLGRLTMPTLPVRWNGTRFAPHLPPHLPESADA